ncbi:MAG: patatin-like phospholipase family protein [Anaerolineae bacterium]
MIADLRSISFFSNVPEEMLDVIAQRLPRAHFRKGELVVLEGEPGDSMYLIESGRVQVVTEEDGQEKILRYLEPGNFFGESALLTGRPRSASVRVAIDSELIVITRDNLFALIKQYPVIAVSLTRELGRRLSVAGRAPPRLEEHRIVAVNGGYALTLARRLAEVTAEDVLLLDIGGMQNVPVSENTLTQTHVKFARIGENVTPDVLPARLSALVQEYYWLVLAIPTEASPVARKAVELANDTAYFGDMALPWLAEIAGKNYWHLPHNAKMIDRIARRMAQRQVGIALSSGGARGLAHIGVFQALEEAGIPIDRVAATSMGALIGSMYCAGLGVERMTDWALHIGRQWRTFTDVLIPPHWGFLRGNNLLEHFRRLMDDRHFEDLETPLSIIAVDVFTSEEVIFESGPVAEAMRASASLLPLLEPAHIGEHYLVDGGAANPFPTNILADKGMNVILGSSTIPSLLARIHRKEQLKRGRSPDVVGIMLGQVEIMESEIIRNISDPNQILIDSDVVHYSILDFFKGKELIAVGDKAAQKQIDAIRQRLAPTPRLR